MSLIANKTVLSRMQLIGTGVPPVQIKRIISQSDASSQVAGSASMLSTAAPGSIPVDPSTQLSPIITPYTTIPQLSAQKVINESKKPIKIGKYTLHELQACDSYNTAISNNDNSQFYWKKFSKKNYMKKLEPYHIMSTSECVHKIHEIVHDGEDVYVFYETHYGDLHSYMKEKKKLKESEAKEIFYQMTQAVNECHENGIIVRDIKLKKFVFANSERTVILLTNLEDCLVLDDSEDDLIKSQQGCPAYVSPEVLNPCQNFYSGKLSDSWSLGIVMYTLLFGRYPFHHNVITTMFAKISKGKFAIPTSGISLNAKILLRSLIRLKPEERLLPNEILSHNWLKDVPFTNHFCNKIDYFIHTPVFQKQAVSRDSEMKEASAYFVSDYERALNRQASVLVNNLKNVVGKISSEAQSSRVSFMNSEDDHLVPSFNN